VIQSAAHEGGGEGPEPLPCDVCSRHVLYQADGSMGGWPSLLRCADGELAAVYSGGRRQHVDPFGKTLLQRSRDDGDTWSAPETANNTLLDDRDPGLVETPSGVWVLSYFTSRAFADWAAQARKHFGDD
jgi:hypothetical protein